MSEIKFKGIVIKSKDYKEKDKLLTLYTLEFGKINAVLRGVKNFKAKLKFAKEIFCFGEFIIAKGKGLNIITACESIETFHSLSNDLDSFYEACAVIDILDIITKEEEADPALFIEILKCLNAISSQDVKVKYPLIKFLCSIFSSSGYMLKTDSCSSCQERFFEGEGAYLDLTTGEILCKQCKSDFSILISSSSLKAIDLISQTDYERLHTLNLCPSSEAGALNVLEANFKERFSKSFKNLLK